jgi:hypothetical protein
MHVRHIVIGAQRFRQIEAETNQIVQNDPVSREVLS